MRRFGTMLAVEALSCLLLAIGPAARAAYPGENGRLFFAAKVNGNADIYSARPDGSGLRRLTTNPGNDLCAAVSPDGREVAFCSDRGGNFEIWTMGVDGSHQRRLTHLGGFAIFPDFSPSGEAIAFAGGGPTAQTDDIFVTRPRGGNVRQLTENEGNNDYPAYSPDGRTIAFVSDRTGTPEVWEMGANGSHQVEITYPPIVADQLPDWSPDGTKIAFVSDSTGNGDVYVMDPDGSNIDRLTFGHASDFGTAWSPDGTKIAFVRDPGDGVTRPIYVMHADGSHKHVLIPGLWGYVPGWQPRAS